MPNSDIKEQIKQNFSDRAHDYNNWAKAQKTSSDILVSLLPNKNFNNVLDIGCGTGFLVEQIKKLYNPSKVTGIDFAPKMISHCKNLWPGDNFVCADIGNFCTNEKYDLIASNFTFQWVDDIPNHISTYFSLLKKNGVFAVAVPVAGSLEELRVSSSRANKKPLHIHSFPNERILTDTFSRFTNHRFYHEIKNIEIYYSKPIHVVKSIKQIGATYTHAYSYTATEMRRFLREYEKTYSSSEELYPLTYKVLFIIAKKEHI